MDVFLMRKVGIKGWNENSVSKPIWFSFITEQIDAWYEHLLSKNLEMREVLADSETIPVRAFVTNDTAGYFLEFDRFLPDERNNTILRLLGRK